MDFEVGSIREIHDRLVRDGYHISEYMIRRWTKDGTLSCVPCGCKVLVSYSALVTLLTNGTASTVQVQ